MTVRIGANPICWSNDDMQSLGDDISLETCLREAKEIGFQGMELGHKFPRDAAGMRRVLSPHGLEFVSGWYSAALLERDADAEIKAMRAHLDLLKGMGCQVMVFAETSNAIHGDIAKPLSQRPTMPAGGWAQFGRRMTEVARAALSEGVRIVYHHHMGTVVQTESDIAALMDSTGPEVSLLLDTGHATFAGIDPVAAARRWRSRIAHVHAKDVRPAMMKKSQEKDWSFLTSVVEGTFTVPGDGMVDFDGVFAALPGYQGWVVLEAEQDPKKAPPLQYAGMGYRNLLASLQKAGLR